MFRARVRAKGRVKVNISLFIQNEYERFLRGNYSVLSYSMLLKTVVANSSSDFIWIFCSCPSSRLGVALLEGLVLSKLLSHGKYVAPEDVKLWLFPRQFTLNASGEKGLPRFIHF